MNHRKKDQEPPKSSSNEKPKKQPLSTEAKAARLKEILERVARRENEDADEANDETQDQSGTQDDQNDQEEQDLLEKIQRTYQKYLEKKEKKAPKPSMKVRNEQDQKDLQEGSVTWKYVTYEDLDKLDLDQESNKTATLFVFNLILMIVLLFCLVGILAITMIVSYAYDEVEELHSLRSVDSSILKHNLFQFLTLMPSIMIVLQILINVMLILYDTIDEVFFYMRENGAGIWTLRVIFGLSALLLTGMLGYCVSEQWGQQERWQAQNEQTSVGEGNEQGTETTATGDEIQFKHILACIFSCLHALSLLLHAQSKLKDAEFIYMRYMYDKHKHKLPKGTAKHRHFSSDEEIESYKEK